MRRIRFSIASLLALVFVVALAIAALRAATVAWDIGIFGLTLLVLVSAILLAIHRPDRKRAFWLGFALFGWVYLGASLVPPIESRLPTSKALAWLDSKVPGRARTFAITLSGGGNPVRVRAAQALAFSPQGQTLAANVQGNVMIWDTVSGRLLAGPNGNTEDFLRIGHSWLALLGAFLGGHLSRYLHDQGRRLGAGPHGVAGPDRPEPV